MFMHTLIMRIALLVVALATACSHVDEITPRKYVGLIVGHTASLKIEIAKSLITNPAKPVISAGALQLPPPSGIAPMKFDFGWVTAGGAILIQNKEYGVTILQEPTVVGSAVKWSCVVSPVEAKPTLCGSE